MSTLEGPAKHSVEETRLRIIAAARTVYACKGARGTTTREVAECAGVNEATLFRHFGTKHALIEAMREHYASAGELRDAIAQLSGSVEEDLRAIGLQFFDHMMRNRDLIRMSLAEATNDPESCSSTMRFPRAKFDILSEFFRARIASGELRGSPEWLAGCFISVMFAAACGKHIWTDDDHPMNNDSLVGLWVETFLNGVRAH
jgi:AcrR family transcriptional regulator